jgi:hypothetical protein
MDKKNVQKRKAWIFYGNSLDCEHILKLRSCDQKNNFYFVSINFPFFFAKIHGDFFCSINIEHLEQISRQKSPKNFHVKNVTTNAVKRVIIINTY